MAPILLLVACERGTPAPVVAVTPDRGSLAAYTDVRISGLDVGNVLSVHLGGVAAYNFRVDGADLIVTIQGAEAPGAVDLTVTTSAGIDIYPSAYTYEPPIDPLFDRVVGIGASFTEGVQSGVPWDHGALVSPGAVVARQVGAYYSMPILIPELFPQLGPSDIGPAPACEIPDIADFVGDAAADVIANLHDPETHAFAFFPGRVDPDMIPRDLAVGGSKVDDLLVPKSDVGQSFLSHLVYEPYGRLGEAASVSQAQMAVNADPSMIVSFDLLGNDIIPTVISGSQLEPSFATPVEDIRAGLEILIPMLADTGAEVFLANAPDPTVLGGAQQRRANMAAEAGDAAAAQIAEIAIEYNAVLNEIAAPFPNIHIVDMAAEVADIAEHGVDVGGTNVKITVVGGFVSLDGLHFSDTGYGVLGNLFIRAINDAEATQIPEADLVPILANDSFSVDSLVAGGFDVSACR